MNGDALLSLLQFSDGLFPAGSYAHSLGLETYASEQTIRDAEGVLSFLLAYLQGSAAPTDTVAAMATRRTALLGGAAASKGCMIIDHTLDAMKPATELRNASRQMGRQVLRIASELGGAGRLQEVTTNLFRAVEAGTTPGHHAVAFGVVSAASGWPEAETAYAYLYSACAGLTAGALRLLPLGQLAGQRILRRLAPAIASLAEEAQGKKLEDAWSFAPGLEIAAMLHATLDARLFRS